MSGVACRIPMLTEDSFSPHTFSRDTAELGFVLRVNEADDLAGRVRNELRDLLQGGSLLHLLSVVHRSLFHLLQLDLEGLSLLLRLLLLNSLLFLFHLLGFFLLHLFRGGLLFRGGFMGKLCRRG